MERLLKNLIEKMSKSDHEKEVKTPSGISLSSRLVAGGFIIGLVGIALQVTGIIKPGTQTGFVSSNGMAIILLVILILCIYFRSKFKIECLELIHFNRLK